MSRTRRFLGGVTLGYLNMGVVTIVGLWLTVFYLGRLGEHDYGLWLVVAQMLGYLALLDLGVVALLPREVAYATGQAPEIADHAVTTAAAETLTLALWQLPLVALAATAVLFLLPADWGPLRGPLTVVLGTFVLVFPARIFPAMLRGLQDLAALGAIQTGSWAAGVAVAVAGVLSGLGLYGLAGGWAVTQLVAPILCWVRLRRRFPGVRVTRPLRRGGGDLRTRLRASGWVSVSQVAQVLVAGTDLLILGRVIGPGAVVLYYCTAKLVTVLQHQPVLLMEAAQPGLAQMRTAESRERLAGVSGALIQALLIMSGGVACVVIGVNSGFVTWWVGADFDGGMALTGVIVGAMLVRHWNTGTVYALFALGRERRIAVTTLADGLFTVASQIALAAAFGPIGIAAGALAGAALVSLPANLAGLASETGGLRPLLAAVTPWSWRFALGLAVALLLATSWRPQEIPGLVVATLAVGAAYLALVTPLALRGALAIYVRPRLARLRAALLSTEPV